MAVGDVLPAWALALITVFLIANGAILYAVTLVGWAQGCWLLASATGGASITLALERR